MSTLKGRKAAADYYYKREAELTRLREENARLREALEGLASGQCCETPGCSTDDPKCEAMIARQALEVPS